MKTWRFQSLPVLSIKSSTRAPVYHDSWCSHFIICRLPEEVLTVPVAVSIVPTPCATSHNNLMVLNREPVQQKQNHGLCISPLYSNWKNWTMIVEWFEIHRLLGAEGMVIYNRSISYDTHIALRHYMEDASSNVQVIQWPFPRFYKSSVYCQRAALNDCLYRLGHTHHYVTITDLDEIIVPRVASTWPGLMAHVQQPEIGVYTIQHLYYRRNHTEPGYLPLGPNPLSGGQKMSHHQGTFAVRVCIVLNKLLVLICTFPKVSLQWQRNSWQSQRKVSYIIIGLHP